MSQLVVDIPALPGATWAVRTTCCQATVAPGTATALAPGPHDVEVSFAGLLGAAQVAGTLQMHVHVPPGGSVRLSLPLPGGGG